MNIKLRKFFYIFHWQTIVSTILRIVIFLFLIAVFHPKLPSSVVDLKLCLYCFFFLFLLPISIIVRCLSFPGELVINGLSITFREIKDERLCTREEYIDEPPKFFSNYHKEYRIENATIWITSFEFRQNFIEKLFNVGHIRFIGKTLTRDEICKKITFYGIPDFDTTKQEIERYFEQQKYESYFE